MRYCESGSPSGNAMPAAVSEKQGNRAGVYALPRPAVPPDKGFLSMDKELALVAVRKFSDSVRTILDPVMVVMYGSYARGTQSESSDIDVAVVVDRVEGDFLDQEARLYRIRRDIDDRIEPVLLEKGNDRSGFLRSIMDSGEIVYRR